MAVIQMIYAREILDSRGIPTVECTVWLDTGVTAISSAPAGTSRGKYEALELRDFNNPRMMGNGVLTADHSWIIKITQFQDRKSTRLNSSHTVISYAVFCLKKKTKNSI